MVDTSALTFYQQIKKFKNAKNDNDRLGKLPESVLGQILSLLPTKDAVGTSVLSTDWKYMWTLATDLHFNDRLIYSSRKKSRKLMFMNFVERVLLLQGNLSIESFNLSCFEDYDKCRLHSWISTAIRRNAIRININCLVVKPTFVFPRCVYESKSLAELELRMRCVFKVPTSTYFSSLKTLYLREVTLENESFSVSKELHLSFPVLEVLHLENCEWVDMEIVNIYVPVLQSFTAENCKYMWTPNSMFDCTVNICGPCLAKFKLGGNTFVEFILRSPSSVVDATIEVSTVTNNWDPIHLLSSRAFSLLSQFSNVTNLTLSNATLKVLAIVENLQDRLPIFGNLINLTLSRGDLVIDKTLMTLLWRSPALESLIFAGGISNLNKEDMVQGREPQCLMSELKAVMFQYFSGCEAEIEVAKFFLKNAKFLERMTIVAYGKLRWGVKTKNKLLKFPRGSSCAKLSFC